MKIKAMKGSRREILLAALTSFLKATKDRGRRRTRAKRRSGYRPPDRADAETEAEAEEESVRRVLSLWQPWASLCVLQDPLRNSRPPKMWETRHWIPRQVLPIAVAIHATKTRNPDVLDALSNSFFSSTLERCGVRADDLPFGAIIGVAFITVLRPTETLLPHWLERIERGDHTLGSEMVFGNYQPRRFAWGLSQARAIAEPIPFKGRQEALYELDAETDAAIDAQLEGALTT